MDLHKLCVQGKEVYTDSSTYPHGLFPTDNENAFFLSTVHISFYPLSFEFTFIITDIVPFQIIIGTS